MAGRRSLPLLLCLALILFSVLPWPLPGATTLAPMPLIGAVYYWTIYRADLMPGPMVFLLAVVQDLLSGGPLGLTAALLLAGQWMLLGQARLLSRVPFFLELIGFAVMAILFGLATWLCMSAFYGRILSPNPLILQVLLGLCLYPILNWIFGLTRTVVLRMA